MANTTSHVAATIEKLDSNTDAGLGNRAQIGLIVLQPTGYRAGTIERPVRESLLAHVMRTVVH